ncbi:MAG: amidase, partial [Blastocatellia bacterium]|nr:amidase [Blastocatellia bacterium]
MKKRFTRRTFVKLLPAAGAASFTVASTPHAQQQAAQQPPQKIAREMLHCTEQLMGIDLTEEQETMALGGVNRNLASYEALRKIDVPLDTEPAFAFHPALPGKKFNTTRTRLKMSKVELPKFDSIEDLAFANVTQLAEFVRTRRVSPVELTKMYLDRLKKYGPKLLCVVTLTEELALEQAEDAEREIKHGKYRGPLHGIPCGVKDLFATKGIKTTWGAEPFREQMIDHDAAVVERLRDAGAVLLAKLSMGALAMGGRWFAGVTRNPWQPEESTIGSSGSSAGSASATSAGLVGFALGTETL